MGSGPEKADEQWKLKQTPQSPWLAFQTAWLAFQTHWQALQTLDAQKPLVDPYLAFQTNKKIIANFAVKSEWDDQNSALLCHQPLWELLCWTYWATWTADQIMLKWLTSLWRIISFSPRSQISPFLFFFLFFSVPFKVIHSCHTVNPRSNEFGETSHFHFLPAIVQ